MFHVNGKALKFVRSIFRTRVKGKFRIDKKSRAWWNQHMKDNNRYCVIVREKPGQYYLCIPDSKKSTTLAERKSIVALDPGVRTFQTFYSPEGICGKLGAETSLKLTRYAKKNDQLTSILSKTTNARTRRNLRSRCFELRTKIRNIVRDLHWKCANYLCQNFQQIILPMFETSQMTCKRLRKIQSKIVRKMLQLSHYQFRQRLLYKASCYRDTRVILTDEAYTTKTCGQCGELRNIKEAKVFQCLSCQAKIDRDLNGARNILIKFLTENAPPEGA